MRERTGVIPGAVRLTDPEPRQARHGDATESSLIAVPLDGSGTARTLLGAPRRISALRPSADGSLLA
jgi:hypothetical protein